MSDQQNCDAGQTLPAPTLFGVLEQRWWETTLDACPPGLFLHDGSLGFKSEYRDKNGPEAYCVPTGEFFWGGTDDVDVRMNLKVTPLIYTPNSQVSEAAGRKGNNAAAQSSFAAPAGCLASIPHKCPKCDGQGIVSKPPWVAGDVHEWSSAETIFPCNVCHGAKIIWSKPDNDKSSHAGTGRPN